MTKVTKKCSVGDCNQATVTRGFCGKHYARVRAHGDPSVTKSPNRGKLWPFIYEVAKSKEMDECITWPFGRDGKGYGHVKRAGKMEFVHRMVCEIRHGPAPEGKPLSLHTCGKGHLRCVNPNHLYWGDYLENYRDSVAHGSRDRG